MGRDSVGEVVARRYLNANMISRWRKRLGGSDSRRGLVDPSNEPILISR